MEPSLSGYSQNNIVGESGAQESQAVNLAQSKEDDSSSTSSGKEKGPAKARKGENQAYETMSQEETTLLVNLWVSNHERLESKDSRKQWSSIVEELNSQFKTKRTVDKCKRRMKYLVDKYKEKKDWNRKQSGGSLWKSPFYDEIDSVLGVRDAVTFENVEEVQDSPESSTSSSSCKDDTSPTSEIENGAQKRKERKKRRRSWLDQEDDEESSNNKNNEISS